jgi:hypothetical protein
VFVGCILFFWIGWFGLSFCFLFPSTQASPSSSPTRALPRDHAELSVIFGSHAEEAFTKPAPVLIEPTISRQSVYDANHTAGFSVFESDVRNDGRVEHLECKHAPSQPHRPMIATQGVEKGAVTIAGT